jgi:hypothetical protein
MDTEKSRGVSANVTNPDCFVHGTCIQAVANKQKSNNRASVA